MKRFERFQIVGWVGLFLFAGSCSLGSAQFAEAPQVPPEALHSPALRPPVGAKVAIVEFADLECPLCAAWNPILMQAAARAFSLHS